MALTLVTVPSGEPVSLDEAKLQCRVDWDDDNALIDTLIQAAREYCEAHTRRAFHAQTWDLKLDHFHACEYFEDGAIRLPKPPVSAVSSVTYIDQNGVSQTWSADDWDADLPAGPKAARGRLYPVYSESYPTARREPNAVTIRFVCGYGTAADVPAAIKSAMLLLIGHWYSNREALGRASALTEIPLGVDALLAAYVAH